MFPTSRSTCGASRPVTACRSRSVQVASVQVAGVQVAGVQVTEAKRTSLSRASGWAVIGTGGSAVQHRKHHLDGLGHVVELEPVDGAEVVAVELVGERFGVRHDE